MEGSDQDETRARLAPVDARRRLKDDAVARWAASRVGPEELAAARAAQGALTLLEELVLRESLELGATAELSGADQALTCAGCGLSYFLPARLIAAAGGLSCPACESPLPGATPGASPQEQVEAELLARWARTEHGLGPADEERARASGTPLREALVLEDLVCLSDIMEALDATAPLGCDGCAGFTIGAGLLAYARGLSCPACGGRLAPDAPAPVLSRSPGESDGAWLVGELIARWAIARGVPRQEVLAARAEPSGLHEALVLGGQVDPTDTMELLEGPGQDIACAACEATYSAPARLAALAPGTPCPACGEALGETTDEASVEDEVTPAPFDLARAMSVLDRPRSTTRRAQRPTTTRRQPRPAPQPVTPRPTPQPLTPRQANADRTASIPATRPLAGVVNPDPTVQGAKPQARIGPYELVYRLGRGGMGEVWAARAPDHELVALKILSSRSGQSGAVDDERRLAREGEALERLDHPNVVRLLARGTDATTASPYLALELVLGADLAAILANRADGRLELQEGGLLLQRCALGLAAAHERGILHRDLKPSNVLVTARGDVKLADFGIALEQEREVTQQRLTATGIIVGTPSYVAPEVLTQGSLAWTPAADVYALGCLAFRALTGEQVFEGSLALLIKSHESLPPRALRELVPEAPAALDALLGRMLAKEPARRPTAREVEQELGALVPDRTTIAGLRIWSQVATLAGRPTPETSRPKSGGFAPGQVFQHYRIQSQLGKGGMGVVYKAFHTGLKKTVALKVLLSGALAGENERRRFLREAESAAALQHAAVVPVLDAGEHEGTYYLTMEYVQGKALSEHYRGGAGREDLVRLLAAICDGVHHAHSRGVIHRDLKPDNIIVDEEGNPHILDFGIAKKADSDDTHAVSVTNEGDILGTLRYMPPEQASGQTQDVDVRSDVWALGVILYELVTGGTTPFMGSVREILHQVLFVEVRAPSLTPGLLEKKAEVPWELDAICLKALEKDRDLRYQSALELKRDLLCFLAGEPIAARQATLAYRARKWLSRNRGKAAAAAAAVLLAGSLVLAWTAERAHREEERLAKIAGSARASWEQLAAGRYSEALSSLGIATNLIGEEETLHLDPDVVGSIPRELLPTLDHLHGAPRVTAFTLRRWTEYVDGRRQGAEALAALEDALADARADLARGEVSEAVEPWRLAQRLDPRHPGVAVVRGELLAAFLARARAAVAAATARPQDALEERRRDLEVARRGFEGARSVDKESEEAVQGLAAVRLAAEQLARDVTAREELGRARAFLARATELQAEASVRLSAGDDDAGGERLGEAREALLQALFLQRDLKPAWDAWVQVALALGEVALRADDLGIAEQQLKHARKGPGGREYVGPLAPDIEAYAARLAAQDREERAFRAHRQEGDRRYEAGELAQALVAYELALAARPDPDVARRHDLCRELVRADEAADLDTRYAAVARARALHHDPQSLDDRLRQLGDQLYERDMVVARAAHEDAARRGQGWQRVAELYERALGHRPGDPEAQRWRADAYAERDRPRGMALVSIPRRLLVTGASAALVGPSEVERFYVDRLEVRNADYARFVAGGGYEQRRFWDDAGWVSRRTLVDATGRSGPAGWVDGAPQAGTDDLPVTGVSWYEARAYAAARGARLPSEDEWLLAASFDPATNTRFAFPWGDAPPERRLASQERLVAAGSAAEDESPWGVRDLSFNASEWVVGPDDEAVVRGLSFRSFRGDLARGVTGWRKSPPGGFRDAALGLRCAQDVPPTPPLPTAGGE